MTSLPQPTKNGGKNSAKDDVPSYYCYKYNSNKVALQYLQPDNAYHVTLTINPLD